MADAFLTSIKFFQKPAFHCVAHYFLQPGTYRLSLTSVKDEIRKLYCVSGKIYGKIITMKTLLVVAWKQEQGRMTRFGGQWFFARGKRQRAECSAVKG